MPTLTLKFEDMIQGKYPLEKGKSLTIGRKEDNDIVIDNLAVSGNHAKVEYLDKGILLTDLKSKNGTFVNGTLITSHWLKNGETITIGKHNLDFSVAKTEEQPEEGDLDKTMVLDTDEHRYMMSRSSSKSEGEKARGVLTFLKGGQGEYELDKKLVKIGKDPSSDILISGFTVGKTAATISQRPNGFYLSFVGGLSKPKVNGESISESVRLNEFDTIEIGSAVMEFFIKK